MNEMMERVCTDNGGRLVVEGGFSPGARSSETSQEMGLRGDATVL